MKKIHLLAIDMQNDFCDTNGALFVSGADKDIANLTAFVDRIGGNLFDIHVTMDSHRLLDIAHPIMWVDGNGNHPDPFTIITEDEVKTGKWRTVKPAWQKRAQAYVEALSVNGRYPLCIWPPHCIIGTWGHSLVPSFSEALLRWEAKKVRGVDYVTKGSNIFTEHYSAVQADVPDPSDPTTMLNSQLINILQEADEILIAGEALSHCVANTIRDIANNFGEDNIKKFVMFEDTSSNVQGFEQLGTDFVNEMTGRGMKVSTTQDYL